MSFADPEVSQPDRVTLPEGWTFLKDGMCLGQSEGSIIFEDGSIYGPQSIDLDCSSFSRPAWRFKKRPGTPKSVKGKIPVRKAFEDFLDALSPDPINAME